MTKSTTWPLIGTRWVHTKTKGYYEVIIHTNVGSVRRKYEETVVYQHVLSGKYFSRPVSTWHDSFTPVVIT